MRVMENRRLASHTLFTTLITFWITALVAGLNFSATPGDIAFILIFGSLAISMLVSLPIYLGRLAGARVMVAEEKDLRRARTAAFLFNIGITVGLTVFVYWKLYGGIRS